MLNRTGFLDKLETRSLIISFTTYNIYNELYISTNILFEKGDGYTYKTQPDHSIPFILPRTNVKISLYSWGLLMFSFTILLFFLMVWNIVSKRYFKFFNLTLAGKRRYCEHFDP